MPDAKAQRPLGIGIVGTGQRCMGFYGPHIRSNPEKMRLVALADQSQERLTSAVADLGGDVRSYAGLDAMLQDTDVEAVIITTPDHTHRQLFDQVLDAGKHVLCEKPMATTIEDAVHMATRAIEKPQTVQMGFMLRHAPLWVKLKQVLDSGVIGRLVNITAVEVLEYYHGASFFRRWHRFRANSGGLLVHKACHTLDAINWLVGSTPVWVSARGGLDTFVPDPRAASRCRDCSLTATCPAAYRMDHKNFTYQTGKQRADLASHAGDICVFNSVKDTIDNAAVMVRYANGTDLNFSFITTGAVHERYLHLGGQRGEIQASQAEGVIRVRPVGEELQTIVLPEELRSEHGGGDAPLMDSFVECVATGRRPVADVVSGLHSVALGVGATRSIDLGGEPVDLRPYLLQPD